MMNLKRCLVLCFLFSNVLVFSFGQDFDIKRLVYRTTTGDEAKVYEYLIEKNDNGYVITESYEDETRKIDCDISFAAVGCEIKERTTNKTINCLRAGNKILVRSESTNRTLKIDEEVWYQTPYALIDFIKSGEKSREYWLLDMNFDEKLTEQKALGAIKMVAKRKKVETIINGNANIEAVRVLITFPDMRSLFWKATYWYRKADGVLIRFEEVRGAPGTPKTIGELISAYSSAGSR